MLIRWSAKYTYSTPSLMVNALCSPITSDRTCDGKYTMIGNLFASMAASPQPDTIVHCALHNAITGLTYIGTNVESLCGMHTSQMQVQALSAQIL